MTERAEHARRPSILMGAAALIIVIAGMRAASAIIVPFLLSVFIAMICAPGLFWMQKKGLPRGLAVVVILAIVIAVGFLVVSLVIPAVASFAKAVPAYQERLAEKVGEVTTWLKSRGIVVADKALSEYINPGTVMKITSRTLTGFSGALTNVFMILLTVIFILLEASEFPGKLRAAFGKSEDSLDYLQTIADSISRYIGMKTIFSALTGLCAWLLLVVLGVEYALVWGLLAFLLNYVPNIGSIIAAIPAVLVALIQFGAGKALVVVIGYLLINGVIGSFLEPRFMGERLGLSTLVVFLSLVFWGWVLGPVGMLLSVPLTMIVKVGLENHEGSRWVAVLLSSRVAAPAPEKRARRPRRRK